MTVTRTGNASPGGQKRPAAYYGFQLILCLLPALPLLADWVAVWLGWHIFFLADGRIQSVWATLVLLLGGWPVFATLTQQRFGFRSGAILVVGLAAAGFFAAGMYVTYAIPLSGSHDLFQAQAVLLVAATGSAWVSAAAGQDAP